MPSSEITYLVLIFALFVVPKALQRFRFPAAVTSLLLGVVASQLGLFAGDPTLALLSTLGISGLFLFAGLDVDAQALRTGAKLVATHLVVQVVILAGAVYVFTAALGLAWRPATLLALALLTPSTGFILDSLPAFGLHPDQAFWTRTKAIATELIALAIMFAVLQSSSVTRLAGSILALAALVVVIPFLMRVFAAVIAPWAPRSEFTFLVMLAMLAAFATRLLGVYYLVGAFLVGVAARRFQDKLPALSSDRLLAAIEVFASFFAPFYFFNAGAHLRPELLSLGALATGAAYVVLFIPLRVASVVVVRRFVAGERWKEALHVAVPLLPTLVFSLVLAGLLVERFEIASWLVGGLIPYTLANTIIPGILYGTTASFESPHTSQATGSQPGL